MWCRLLSQKIAFCEQICDEICEKTRSSSSFPQPYRHHVFRYRRRTEQVRSNHDLSDVESRHYRKKQKIEEGGDVSVGQSTATTESSSKTDNGSIRWDSVRISDRSVHIVYVNLISCFSQEQQKNENHKRPHEDGASAQQTDTQSNTSAADQKSTPDGSSNNGTSQTEVSLRFYVSSTLISSFSRHLFDFISWRNGTHILHKKSELDIRRRLLPKTMVPRMTRLKTSLKRTAPKRTTLKRTHPSLQITKPLMPLPSIVSHLFTRTSHFIL